MNNKMIVAMFDDEKHAYAGFKALNDLHAEGSITRYASALIAKDADGKVTIKQEADEGPLGRTNRPRPGFRRRSTRSRPYCKPRRSGPKRKRKRRSGRWKPGSTP